MAIGAPWMTKSCEAALGRLITNLTLLQGTSWHTDKYSPLTTQIVMGSKENCKKDSASGKHISCKKKNLGRSIQVYPAEGQKMSRALLVIISARIND